jgi:protein disulfide-isomerase A1
MYFHLAFAVGKFDKSAIVDFVTSNKIPLVTVFTRESAPTIFENPIKKQVIIYEMCLIIT